MRSSQKFDPARGVARLVERRSHQRIWIVEIELQPDYLEGIEGLSGPRPTAQKYEIRMTTLKMNPNQDNFCS